MKRILQLSFCFIFSTCICSFSIGQSDQQSTQPKARNEKIDWSNYKEKMGFPDEIEFTPTGQEEKDQEKYLQLIMLRKTAALKKHNTSQRPGNSGRNVPPSNDLCADAIPVTCGSSTVGSTVEATFDDAGFCGTPNTSNGVWYRLTPPAGGSITLSTCNQADFDTKISVFTGDCGDLTCVTGQDDNFAECGFDFTTKLSFCATADQEYLILIHGFNIATGNFTLSVSCNSLAADAGECQSRFIGYGPAEEEVNYLCTEVSGGVPPYSYSWTPEDDILETNGECIAVQPDITTTYTVEVTDAKGCSVSDEVTVNVIDVSAPCPGNNKIQVCHISPGNSSNQSTKCLDVNAVPTHLNNHGDRLGPCENICLATNENPFEENSLRIGGVAKLFAIVFPNPFDQTTTIKFEVPEDTHTTIDIFSATGAKVIQIFNAFVEAGVETTVEFDAQDMNTGLAYYVIRTKKGNVAQGKLILIE